MHADAPLPPILVVDDNPTDVFFLQRGLVAAGIKHPLRHVSDGFEAIETLEREFEERGSEAARPWLLFVDLKMPRVDGFEVLQWLKERGLTEQMSIAVLTTSDEPADIQKAERLGAHRFLVKYPPAEQLAEVFSFAHRRATSGAAATFHPATE